MRSAWKRDGSNVVRNGWFRRTGTEFEFGKRGDREFDAEEKLVKPN